jgi:exopolyphosphatase/guanosine-5'-triphosphate,3'-diphosphate pyrophosphatase
MVLLRSIDKTGFGAFRSFRTEKSETMTINGTRFAAIDIGSNAVRLLLSEVFDTDIGPFFRKISLIRMPVRLGKDAFIQGGISSENTERLVSTIKGFKHLICAYQPVDYRACATSAMRESSNGIIIKERIKKQTGVDIQIITGEEEAKIIFANKPWNSMTDDGAWLYVDVGGGSTEVTLFSNHKIESKSFNIGTIRLLEKLVKKSQWKEMKAWVKAHTEHFSRINAIGSGGNINKLIKLSKHSDKKSITYKKMKKVKACLKPLSFEDRIVQLGLKPDRADVIMPALKIYMSVMKWSGIEHIGVPQIGLADGLVRLMYRKHRQTLPQQMAANR